MLARIVAGETGGMWSACKDTVCRLCLRQPLLPAAVVFLLGIHCGYGAGQWHVALSGLMLCACAALRWRGNVPGRGVRRVASMLFLGWFLAAWDHDGRIREVAQLAAKPQRAEYCCRVGPRVTSTPLRGKAARYCFQAEAFRARREGLVVRHLPVDVTWYGARVPAADNPVPCPGDVWRMAGTLRTKTGRDGLPRLAIHVGEERSCRLAAADPASWRSRVTRARQEAGRRVALGIASWERVPALNQAMLLGTRHALPLALRRVFADSGTIHVFAISGLHIVLVATVLTLAISLLGVPRPWWAVCAGPLLIFYTVATGARPSAVRACLMSLVYLAAPLFGRRPNAIAALAGTVLLVYGFQPWLLYDIGSTLSFSVMTGLLVFCRPFCHAGRRLGHLHLLTRRMALLEHAGSKRKAGALRLLATVLNGLVDSLAVSLAAWLASVPLTAHYFGRFTPGGVFANLIIVPCAFAVVVAGFLGLLTSYLNTWVAVCFNHAAGFFTCVMVRVATWVAALPGASLRVAKWPGWMVWLWFALLLAFAMRLHVKPPEDGLAWLKEDPAPR